MNLIAGAFCPIAAAAVVILVAKSFADRFGLTEGTILAYFPHKRKQ